MQITKYVKLPPPPKKKMYYFQPAITSADWKVVLPQFHQKGLTKPSIWSIPSQCPARFENKAAMQNQSRRGNTHTHTHKKKKEQSCQRRPIKDIRLEGNIDAIPKYQISVTSTTEFFSNLFFTLTSLTRLAPEGRSIICSWCLISIGSGGTEKLVLKMCDMLIASSSNRLPWQRPSMYSCRTCMPE